MNDTLMAEESIEEMLQIGYSREPAYYRLEIERLEHEHDRLRQNALTATNGQRTQRLAELEALSRQLSSARRDYELAQARQKQPTPA